MTEDQESELKAWTKPEVVDVDADTRDVMNGTGASPDGFTTSSS